MAARQRRGRRHAPVMTKDKSGLRYFPMRPASSARKGSKPSPVAAQTGKIGMSGWIAWMFLPQNFIASVRLNLSIDFNRTGKLDDLEEARLIGIVEDSLHSDDIMEKVFRQSDQEDFRTFYNTTQIYRTNEDWSLTVTGEDPEEI